MSTYYGRSSKDLQPRSSRKTLSESPPSSPSPTAKNFRHDRVTRTLDSSSDKVLGRSSSYTRRETRLTARNRQENEDLDLGGKDYRKMYEEALQENGQLKVRLQDSKHELVKIRSQLDKVTQRQDRMSERSSSHEAEKREKLSLEKKVSDMEEDLKACPALSRLQACRRGILAESNACLLAENRAMTRVLARLAHMAPVPETVDL